MTISYVNFLEQIKTEILLELNKESQKRERRFRSIL